MAPWLWIIIALVVVAAVAVAALAMRRRRSTALRDQFGPEYERTLQRSDNPRAAEADLRSRTKQRRQLDIKPLPPVARTHYIEQWEGAQQQFVDDPVGALSVADRVVTSVMVDRGYIVDDFNTRADLISVDHPNVVENFRVAHEINERAAVSQASTEDLRTGLLRYRSLFDELIRDDADRGPHAENGAVTTQREEGVR